MDGFAKHLSNLGKIHVKHRILLTQLRKKIRSSQPTNDAKNTFFFYILFF